VKPAGKPKGGIPIYAVLLLTVLGGAAGGFFGLQAPALLDRAHSPAESQARREAKATAEAAKINLQPLAPITTNLASPADTWIRLESSALIKEDLGDETGPLLAKMSEDIVAYLRTLPLEQIEGPSGFQHLREDLNDRVRVRSNGKVSELVIQALVIE
jgi:flagellar FliL protein